MPDLLRAEVGVIACLATPEALDRLVMPGRGAIALRTAPDEVLFVTDVVAAPDVEREVRDRIAAVEPGALVDDVTDGWAAWSLRGAGAREAFATVSPLEPPEPGAWIQGDVARVPAKILGGAETLTILVAAFHDEYLRERLTVDAGGAPA